MLIIKDVLLIANARSGPTKAAVVVGSDGRIRSILDRCPSDCADAEVVDAEGMIGIPGLVNAHTHSYANMTKALSENYSSPRARRGWRPRCRPMRTWGYGPASCP